MPRKEVVVRSHTRRTKSGKVVSVRQHTAKHEISKHLEGAGEELKKKKSFSKGGRVIVELPNYGLVEAKYLEEVGITQPKHLVMYNGGTYGVTSDKIKKAPRASRKLSASTIQKKQKELMGKRKQIMSDMENDPRVIREAERGGGKYTNMYSKKLDSIDTRLYKLQ